MLEFTFAVGDILDRPGEYRDIHIKGVLSGATALARLDEEPIEADLRAESVVEGILVTGAIRSGTVQQCARCLTEFGSDAAVEVCELFVTSGSEQAKDADSYRVAGTEIHLEPMLRDALVLALPLNPVCRQDCKGLCARCGADLNKGACLCRDDDPDPRWSALAGLRDELERSASTAE